MKTEKVEENGLVFFRRVITKSPVSFPTPWKGYVPDIAKEEEMENVENMQIPESDNLSNVDSFASNVDISVSEASDFNEMLMDVFSSDSVDENNAKIDLANYFSGMITKRKTECKPEHLFVKKHFTSWCH